MLKFLQVFGQGLLYVVLSPFFLAILALYVVYASIVMVFSYFKLIILFFAGRSMYSDLPEDIEAKKILDAHREARQAQLNPQPQPYPLPPYGYPGYPYPPQPGQVINQPVVQEIEAKPVDAPEENKDGEQ